MLQRMKEDWNTQRKAMLFQTTLTATATVMTTTNTTFETAMTNLLICTQT